MEAATYNSTMVTHMAFREATGNPGLLWPGKLLWRMTTARQLLAGPRQAQARLTGEQECSVFEKRRQK